MPSPFPGMDPWLEDEEVFPNLCQSLIVYVSEALNRSMPDGYVSRIKTREWFEREPRVRPDAIRFSRSASSSNRIQLEERLSDPWQESYLEIVSPRGKRLVTAVEVLSRANKRSGDPGRTSYQNKRLEYRASAVNVVEIDLLRTGAHTTGVPLSRLTTPFNYHVCVTVPTIRPVYFVAPIPLADRLPTVPVPLDWELPPVPIDLQAVFDRAYDGGRYPDLIWYDAPPDSPLTAEQQQWADGILKAKGLRA